MLQSPLATRHIAGDALDARATTLNYLNNVLAKMEATAQNAHEAVLLNSEGYISECSADNVFIVKGQRLMTPPAHMGALEGVTRNIVMHSFRDRIAVPGIPDASL